MPSQSLPVQKMYEDCLQPVCLCAGDIIIQGENMGSQVLKPGQAGSAGSSCQPVTEPKATIGKENARRHTRVVGKKRHRKVKIRAIKGSNEQGDNATLEILHELNEGQVCTHPNSLLFLPLEKSPRHGGVH